MAKRVSFPNSQLGLREISKHHSDTEAALKEYYGLSGSNASLPRFLGYSEEMLSAEFQKRIEELEKTSCMTLLSFLEARFRVDYLKSCYEKKKDPLSRDFRAIYKKKENRASLRDDILETWKKHHSEEKEVKNLISDLIDVFNYRHWLAHGRYWEPKLGRTVYDYCYVYHLSKRIFKRLPLIS